MHRNDHDVSRTDSRSRSRARSKPGRTRTIRHRPEHDLKGAGLARLSWGGSHGHQPSKADLGTTSGPSRRHPRPRCRRLVCGADRAVPKVEDLPAAPRGLRCINGKRPPESRHENENRRFK
jgi:hypothetical protein